MKTLEDRMSFYAAYHQDARNKATHFVGVPVNQSAPRMEKSRGRKPSA